MPPSPRRFRRRSASRSRALGGTPTGQVIVKSGRTTILVITLTSGKGAYTLAAASLAGGTTKLTASYAADTHYAGSTSAPKNLAVVKTSSKTTLGLSGVKVTYGAEQHERISVAVKPALGGIPTGQVTVKAGSAVKVSPRYTGTPGGTVTVKANGATLAVIRLRSGTGSYTLSTKRLAVGGYSLAATYSGNADFGPSASGKRSLTVALGANGLAGYLPDSHEGAR